MFFNACTVGAEHEENFSEGSYTTPTPFLSQILRRMGAEKYQHTKEKEK